MKIVRLDRTDGSTAVTATLMADSCRRPDMRPLFVPDGGEWVCEVRAAVRVGRLGKSIRRKFAMRYVDGWTAVNYLRPADDAEARSAEACMTDDALVQGEWRPMPEEPVRMEFGSETAEWLADADFISSELERLSARASFKTGDMLMLPEVLFRYTPERDRHIEIAADASPCLRFNIK